MSQVFQIKCSDFVKRQTPESGFSHFDGLWEELETLVTEIFLYYPKHVRPGYKDGVVLVDIHPINTFYIEHNELNFPRDGIKKFYSAIVKLDEKSKLTANYSPRRDGEAAFIRVSAKANKVQAKYASIVLYRADVLAEDDDRSTDADWEIICIKARVSEEEEPMDPYTMARNFLHLPGGTKGDFTAQQFAESIVYWNNHCMTTGKTPFWKGLWNWFRNSLREFGQHCWEHRPFIK